MKLRLHSGMETKRSGAIATAPKRQPKNDRAWEFGTAQSRFRSADLEKLYGIYSAFKKWKAQSLPPLLIVIVLNGGRQDLGETENRNFSRPLV
jgi:hypothetical protein